MMDSAAYIQAGITLLLIVGLIYSLPHILKKLGLASQIATGKPSKSVVVKSITTVDMKHRLACVEAHGKRHLILLSGHQPVVVDTTDLDKPGDNHVA